MSFRCVVNRAFVLVPHRIWKRHFQTSCVRWDEGGSFLSRILSGQKGQGGQVNVAHSSLLSDKEHVFELVTHDAVSGQVDNYLGHYENYVKVLRKKTKDIHLVGSWKVIIGNQDQVVHLWRYDEGFKGIDHQIEATTNDKELRGTVDEIAKLCTKKRNALMLAFSYWGEPTPRSGGHIYEMRSYVLKPGTMIEWGNYWVKAYKSLEQRKIIREAVWSQPGWDTCVQYTVPLMRGMQSRIMIPTKFSPLQ